jgi:tetratricopeptide (TPR) repeat protein
VSRRPLDTYAFSRPNRIPILASDPRLYPYHRFEGYAHQAEEREWTVVHLENDWVEVWVLPEVGGKVWGARVKKTGHEFIYRNEVMKFRNIALRGPWTSGGIEFNFGVIGHTPATATPVDYLTRENDDGSVSVFVGATDLPSRTRWRVEVRLPADAAYFETRALWENPTPLQQPYYNWMTGAAFARDDLVLTVPGDAYLGHPGEEHAWPVDSAGRVLPEYAENRFGGNKSYHVVGRDEDFFGGYYRDEDWGFGHWSPYGEMPGQKIWLWALSRQGGIWEDLLTDTDGQYVEFQAGRLLVQYSPTGAVNPVSEVGFDPGATDRWTETWFPVQGLGGLTDAARDGAMAVERTGNRVVVRAHAFRAGRGRVRLLVDGMEHEGASHDFAVLEPVESSFELPSGTDAYRVEIPELGLVFDSGPEASSLGRPFSTPDDAWAGMSEGDRLTYAAEQLLRGRRLAEARETFAAALAVEPWKRDALVGLADLEYRRGRYQAGLEVVLRALQLDTYDAEANFVAGLLYRRLGRSVDARESFGWASRSVALRAVAHRQLAELASADGERGEARMHAESALAYDGRSSAPRRILTMLARVEEDAASWDRLVSELESLDPLDPFVVAERLLGAGGRWVESLQGEYPEQEVLEVALTYVDWGREEDATHLLQAWLDGSDHPLVRGWLALLTDDPALLAAPGDPALVFPYRTETLRMLEWAAATSSAWQWRYLLALNLWGTDRPAEARDLMAELRDEPDFAPFYAARALLAMESDVGNPEGDLRRAVELDPTDRSLRFPLLAFLQDAGRWEDALRASGEALTDFPSDFDLELLHAAALVETERYPEAIAVLDRVRVLPSEHSSQAHLLFAQAHTLAGLAALEEGDPSAAARHFETAMTWPERLGQGRPYQPEERVQRLGLARALERSGDASGARRALEAVIDATPGVATGAGPVSPYDALAVPALEGLGRAVPPALAAERDRLVAGSPAGLGSVEDRLLYRVLLLGADTPGG